MPRSCPDGSAVCMIRRSSRYGTCMAEPWTYVGPVAPLTSGRGAVTLVDESTFAISAASGDICTGVAQGLFVRDTRILSRFELLVDGARTEPLAAVCDDPFSATFVSRCMPASGMADSTLMVFRTRHVGQGMREELTLRNFADEASRCTVEIFVDADFADLFAVKEGRAGAEHIAGEVTTSSSPDVDRQGDGSRRSKGPATITYAYRRGGVARRWSSGSASTLHSAPTS